MTPHSNTRRRFGWRLFGSRRDELTNLPGTEYAKFSLPLDYLPSRDYQPRYGYTRPPIKQLVDWFTSYASDYRQFLDLMRTFNLSHIASELDGAAQDAPAWFGGPISAFDSLALYTMIRTRAPRRYFEIGSGMTTRFARQAVTDGRLPTQIISIDPDPRQEVSRICDGAIRESIESCDPGIFDELEAGDIVFLDGSHRCFMNSDVTVFFIDILPRLAPGVLVHVHDIHLPSDYPPMFANWYWNEQYVLAVYLIAGRQNIIPLLPTHFICTDGRFADQFANPFVNLGDHRNESWSGGGSMWFTHKGID